MDIKIIKSPTQGTINMLNRRMAGDIAKGYPVKYDAIGLIQGKLIDMVLAADIAEKAADVYIEEIRGLCHNILHCLLFSVILLLLKHH